MSDYPRARDRADLRDKRKVALGCRENIPPVVPLRQRGELVSALVYRERNIPLHGGI